MAYKNCRIGFIGTGVMGKEMAKNLIKAGYKLFVYNRTKEKAEELIEKGANWKNSPGEVAKEAEITITMVGYPEDVEEIYLGENGIIENAKKGSYIVDMTTSSPLLAKKIYERAKDKGLYAYDAPVSGGDVGAKEGSLSIMVGGDKSAFENILPVLETMGTNIVFQGPAGAGQYTKMANQIAIASNMMGVCESIAYSKKAGLDPQKVLKSIEKGAAGSWSLSNLAPRMMKGDFAPGFYVKHFIKDMNIAIESADKLGINMPGLELAKKLYDKLAKSGDEDSGTQALYKLYNK